MLQPMKEREHAAEAFVRANDARLAGLPQAAGDADVAWLVLVKLCGGDMGLALREAEAALRRRRAGAS